MKYEHVDDGVSCPLLGAWLKMMLAYVGCCLLGFLLGSLLIHLGLLAPETVFDISTKRISYVLPVVDRGVQTGVDPGLVIFFWNVLGALATVSFLYTATWFNPAQTDRFPRLVRRLFCLPKPMRLLCFLPGCRRYEAEALRRLYLWLMVPLLGIMLLGFENGLSISTTGAIMGSFRTGILSLMTHGIVEIPIFALAGAVAYSAHGLVRRHPDRIDFRRIFAEVAEYRRRLPLKRTLGIVVLGLLVAGWIEMHVTAPLVAKMVSG